MKNRSFVGYKAGLDVLKLGGVAASPRAQWDSCKQEKIFGKCCFPTLRDGSDHSCSPYAGDSLQCHVHIFLESLKLSILF